ncbi:MAG: hypothetical protein AAF682_13140 [Planctomycetota bacterium]
MSLRTLQALLAGSLASVFAAPAAALPGGEDVFALSDGVFGELGVDSASAYDPTRDCFLVAYIYQSATLFGPVPQVRVRFIDAATGADVGIGEIEISEESAGTFEPIDEPDIVYNPELDEFYVVWAGLEDDFNREILGQRLRAEDGFEIGADMRLSDMGLGTDMALAAFDPQVAYNPNAGEYMVAWSGSDNTLGLAVGALEIFIQRVDAATGDEVGPNDMPVSRMGQSWGANEFDAYRPQIAYNPVLDEYLVVWSGDTDGAGFGDELFTVFGQRMGVDGVGITPGDWLAGEFDNFPISPVGGCEHVALVYCAASQRFFVAWQDSGALGGEQEIYGLLLDAADYSPLGAPFRISSAGPDGDTAYFAQAPYAAYDEARDEVLVVWQSDADEAAAGDATDIYGQWVDVATGLEVGEDDLRLSTTDGAGSLPLSSYEPAAGYDTLRRRMLVSWSTEQDFGSPTPGPSQSFATFVASPGAVEMIRLGEPANPNALLAGATSGPVLGATWDPRIDHASFAPDALLDVLGISSQPANVPTPEGTLLALFGTGSTLLTAAPGEAFVAPLPDEASLVGLELTAQGAAVTATSFALSNALDLVLGSH